MTPLPPDMPSRHAPPQETPAISCHDLHFRFSGGVEATRGISLAIGAGEFFCLLGANGAGKTTLIRLITGELAPDGGAVEVEGRPIGAGGGRARGSMGILPQSVGLFDGLTVAQHLSCFTALKGIARRDRDGVVGGIVDLFGLSAMMSKRAGTLSLGQQRWVLVALAMLGDPPVIVLDEPTVGMDPVARRALWSILHRAKARGTTLLLTTHYLDEAEQLADRIGFIKEGQLRLCGSLGELYESVGSSVRVSVTDPVTGASLQKAYFDTLSAAQSYVAEHRLETYTVGRVSLEDIYLRVLGYEPVAEGQGSAAEVHPPTVDDDAVTGVPT